MFTCLHKVDPTITTTYLKYEKLNSQHRTHTLQIPDGHQPWTSRPGVKLWGMPSKWKRSREVLDCVAAQALQSALDKALVNKRKGEEWNVDKESVLKSLMADIGQSVNRCNGKLHCLQRGTCLYHFGEDVVLPGRLHALISGYPRGMEFTKKTYHHTTKLVGVKMGQRDKADRDCAQLIGEAYSLPCLTVAHAGIFFNKFTPWSAPTFTHHRNMFRHQIHI